MFPSEPRSSRFWLALPYRGLSIFRQRGFWLGLCAAIWLAAGVWYAVLNLSAEVLLIKAMSSGYSPKEALEGVDYAVSPFPYDQHLRAMRENIDKQLHDQFGKKLR